ncbi:MAG: hypothetical protein RL681_720 [Candidatus Parcubacteria bacterium]|jgi:hypothetical protein
MMTSVRKPWLAVEEDVSAVLGQDGVLTPAPSDGDGSVDLATVGHQDDCLAFEWSGLYVSRRVALVPDALLHAPAEFIKEKDPDVRRCVLFFARDAVPVSNDDGEGLVTLLRIAPRTVLHCPSDLTKCFHVASMDMGHRYECAGHYSTDFSV